MDTLRFMDMHTLLVTVTRTTIPIDSDVRDDLRAEKTGDETYTDVIQRLLENE